MQKHTLLSLLWEVNFAANTCITLNTLQVSFILLVVKSMFKGDIFKNLPGFCFTEKHDWAMKEKKNGNGQKGFSHCQNFKLSIAESTEKSRWIFFYVTKTQARIL